MNSTLRASADSGASTDLLLVGFIGLCIAIVGSVNKQLAASSSHPLELVSLRCALSIVFAMVILYLIKSPKIPISFSFSKSDIQSTIVFIILSVLVGWALLELMKRYSNQMSIIMCSASAILFAILLSLFIARDQESYSKTQWIGIACIFLGLYLFSNHTRV